jgi:hypothetical protein
MRRTFSIKAIHHSAYELQLILKAEVDKIGVDKHTVWWDKCSVMLQK